MSSKSRFTILGIIVLGLLVGLTLSHGFAWIWVWRGWDDMPILSRELPLSSVLGFGIALAAVLFVVKHGHTFQLANEVVDELTKVTWPSREETGNATVVVIVAVTVASLYLGLFDAVWLWITNWILAVPGSGAG
jgi:preprotein translocase SecE subunit